MVILEIILLAFTIFAEASSESIEGKIAVASVIYNRASEGNYFAVIFKPKQFSCYDTSDEVIKHIKRLELNPFIECLVIADQIHSGKIKPVVSGKWYVKKGVKKVWMKSMKIEKEIGNHKFLMEKK